jgi:hypothetical protein
VKGGAYQNIRRNTNNNSPVTSLSSNDLRCNVGGASGGSTTTVSVAAGSTVSFTADNAVYHQGPVSFYLTKVDNAATADGSTDWAKIKEIGPTFSGGQAKWDMQGMHFFYHPHTHNCECVGLTRTDSYILGHNPLLRRGR